MTRIATAAVAALIVAAAPALAGSIKPEMIIRFTKGTIACLSRDHLEEIMIHGVKGEATKMQAMMIDHGGDCLMLSPAKRLKVLSAEYNDPDSDVGILEIVGEDKTTLKGAWALSLGAENITPRRKK
ncbi:MAG TPA: hypothetical protein VKI44_31340 [Acetobacteraceae bacterium]|nr:hypothetical protein [Acetobacteraceae bacterium]